MCPQLCKPLGARALRLIGCVLAGLSVLCPSPDQFNSPQGASHDRDTCPQHNGQRAWISLPGQFRSSRKRAEGRYRKRGQQATGAPTGHAADLGPSTRFAHRTRIVWRVRSAFPPSSSSTNVPALGPG